MTHSTEPEPLVYRMADLPAVTRLSLPTLHRHRKTGVFPKPDRTIGRTPLWLRATIERFLKGDQAGADVA